MLDAVAAPDGAVELFTFAPTIRRALKAVPSRLPGWGVEFDRCEDGDEYACITRAREAEAVALVIPRTGGAVEVKEPHRNASIGTAADPDALIEMLGTWLASPHRRG